MPPKPDFAKRSFHELADKVSHSCSGRQPFALQIGAMDGVRFDLLHPHLSKGGWDGILIEPVPDMFAKLQETYAAHQRLKLVNCAVAEHDGTLTLRRVAPQAVEAGLIPAEALGVSTMYKDRGVLGHPAFAKGFPEVADKYVVQLETACRRLSGILGELMTIDIDLVMIDTEGADWMIAQQLDLDLYNPKLVCLEYDSLTEGELGACCRHFLTYGYEPALCAEDEQNLLFVAPGL